jgi:hypothetical protein
MNAQFHYNIRRGNEGKIVANYVTQIPVKKQIKPVDLKRLYEQGMKLISKEPTYEQKVYRERFYRVDQVQYLSKTDQGEEYNFTCPFPFLFEDHERIPPLQPKNELYEITFEVTYSLFKPPEEYYIRVENIRT